MTKPWSKISRNFSDNALTEFLGNKMSKSSFSPSRFETTFLLRFMSSGMPPASEAINGAFTPNNSNTLNGEFSTSEGNTANRFFPFSSKYRNASAEFFFVKMFTSVSVALFFSSHHRRERRSTNRFDGSRAILFLSEPKKVTLNGFTSSLRSKASTASQNKTTPFRVSKRPKKTNSSIASMLAASLVSSSSS